jgi:hypothetical protein
MRTAVSGRSSPGCRLRPKTAILSLVLPILAAFSCKTVELPLLPPPEPLEPVRKTVVSWEITPAEGYRLDSGFVILDFIPSEALRDQRESPLGGRLTIHLGYLDIRDANTVWYRFEITEGPKKRLRLDGEENIPNVRGPDGYWWNDLDLDLEEPVTGEIRVVVTDTRISAVYPFTLRKVISYQ